MNIALSNKDIKNALGRFQSNVTIMSQNDLKQFKNGTELWNYIKYIAPIALLYEYLPNYGHWTAILPTKLNGRDAIEVFDSYGKLPDDQTSMVTKDAVYSGMKDPNYKGYLTKLLSTIPRDIEITYNNFVKQKSGGNIQTCGRWTILRLLYRCFPLLDFNRLIKNDKQAVELTKMILGK